MITIYHGEDISASRKALPPETTIIEAKDATAERLTQLIEGDSLFGEKKMVAIENLKTLPKGISGDLILWYDHKLTPGQLKEFPDAKIQEFKLSEIVFKFAESIKPGNQKVMLPLFQQFCQQEFIEIVFTMIVRQFRLMLNPSALSGWQKDRIVSQSKHFTPDQLQATYKKLLAIDFEFKNGQAISDLTGSLELFLLNL